MTIAEAIYHARYLPAVWTGYRWEDIQEHQLTRQDKTHISQELTIKIFEKLTENGVVNSFPPQPEGIFQADMVMGNYPYVAPTATTAKSSILTAWFKKGYGPND